VFTGQNLIWSDTNVFCDDIASAASILTLLARQV
jgi:hypothetical protein